MLDARGNLLRRVGRHVVAAHALQNTNHLAGVTELVVVPDVDNCGVIGHHGSQRVHNTCGAGTHEVGGNSLGGIRVTHLAAQSTVNGLTEEQLVQLLSGAGRLGQLHVQDCHGDVRGGNADSVTGQLTLQLRQSL